MARVTFDQLSESIIGQRLESWLQSKTNAEVSPEAQEKIVRMLSPSVAAVRPIPSQGMLIATFLGIFVLCVSAAIPVTGWMGIHLMTGVQIACMMAIFIAGALLFSFTLASQMAPAAPYAFP